MDLKVRVCFHDKCFDGAASAAVFSRFYRERINPAAEFHYTGMTHKASKPFEDGTFGKSAELCLYYRDDPPERRWTLEHGLLGLFDIARTHVANECEWRDTGRWPGVDAPHGTTSPARPDQSIAAPAIAYRNTVVDYNRPPARSKTP